MFFGENPLKVIFAHANEIPLPPTDVNPEIPSDLESVVIKCLEKKPENRYIDVSAIEAALAACGCRDGWTQKRAADWSGGRKPWRVSLPRAKPTWRHCWLPPSNNRRS